MKKALTFTGVLAAILITLFFVSRCSGLLGPKGTGTPDGVTTLENAQGNAQGNAQTVPLTPARPLTPSPVISPTNSTEVICEAKKRLSRLGYSEVGRLDCEKDAAFGVALRHFQLMNHLSQTGRLDEPTQTLLFNEAAVYSPLTPGFPGQAIKTHTPLWYYPSGMLFERLNTLGYLRSDSDDFIKQLFREDTVGAIAWFQKMNQLPVNGALDYPAWKALFSPRVIGADGNAFLQPEGEEKDWATSIYPVAAHPQALAFDGKQLWVYSSSGDTYWQNTVQALQAGQNILEPSIPIYFGEPDVPLGKVTGFAYAGNWLWIYIPRTLSQDGNAQFIKVLTDQKVVAGRSGLPLCTMKPCIPTSAFGYDGSYLWVSVSNIFYGIDPYRGVPLLTKPIGYLANGPVLAVEHCLWVAGESGHIVVSADGSKCPGAEIAYKLPYVEAKVYDGQWIWFTDSGSQAVSAFDYRKGEVVMSIKTGKNPGALAFDGRLIWVANRGENTIRAFDARTGALGEAIAVGNDPVDLLFDGRRLWVANAGSDTVQWIDPQPYALPTLGPATAQALATRLAKYTPSPQKR